MIPYTNPLYELESLMNNSYFFRDKPFTDFRRVFLQEWSGVQGTIKEPCISFEDDPLNPI